MADLSGSGLDPSIVSYLQGGGMPSGTPMPAPQQVSAIAIAGPELG